MPRKNADAAGANTGTAAKTIIVTAVCESPVAPEIQPVTFIQYEIR